MERRTEIEERNVDAAIAAEVVPSGDAAAVAAVVPAGAVGVVAVVRCGDGVVVVAFVVVDVAVAADAVVVVVVVVVVVADGRANACPYRVMGVGHEDDEDFRKYLAALRSTKSGRLVGGGRGQRRKGHRGRDSGNNEIMGNEKQSIY